ncbi:2-oxo-4-hydroxy-4-carboxy-5-ureidoimidazoline decarboxylase-related [Holotrichia oblita]|uniref:2-oxo-4-hydroxy-4-carboxy-5-ureidoimidazoline decarboxylase-related n=1 Tax=Holotrichia oblita TaxID=644536 RepID=A0ACB9T6U6_HOLOL|nr:2-oxo-4-hydroxy-4-carboxy-5-ureidoimidazoline decarboxylase-related [Holotrichia oblita]
MMAVTLSIDEVNKLTSDLFIKIFGNVVEHYSNAAIGILKCKPFSCAEDISMAINHYLDLLSDAGMIIFRIYCLYLNCRRVFYRFCIYVLEKTKVLQLHPDLAGKLAEKGELTNESVEEQKSAGLDVITPENKHKLNSLNEEYKKKFSFPFVICARENKIQKILSSIEMRLHNEHHQELSTGIEEVKKISKLRIYEIVKE